ncbi:MAG: hypothetical protein JO222_15305, partial [Frankiales bacterium]|nr:hypothetical protein [Frankiales bacterium]
MNAKARLPRAVVLSGLSVALAACGTTVPLSSQSRLSSGNGGEFQTPQTVATGAPGASAGNGSAAGPLTGSATVPGGGAPSTGTATAPSGSVPGSTGVTTTGSQAAGPGVTATTVTIGLVYATNSTAADEALGAHGLNTGDAVTEVRLLVNDINKHGGVAGRKLVLLTYGEDATSTQPYAVTAQQMCSFMTQDHKVLAVLVASGFGDAKSCLNHAGTAQFDGNLLGLSDSDGHSLIDFATAAMNIDRSVLAAVRAWTIGNWYAPWNTVTGTANPAGHFKMGILTIDNPELNHAV